MSKRATLAVAVASAASIATSMATWTLDDSIELIGASLDDVNRRTGHAIHVELGGAEENPSGHVAAHVAVGAGRSGTGPTTVRAWITTAGDLDDIRSEATITLQPGQQATIELWANVFMECTDDPCYDDLDLWIDRAPSPNATALSVGGSLDLEAGGWGDPPDNAFVAIDVFPLAAP